MFCFPYSKQEGFKKKSPDSRILEDVVGISVENTIIRDLPEPVKISFHHHALLVSIHTIHTSCTLQRRHFLSCKMLWSSTRQNHFKRFCYEYAANSNEEANKTGLL